jgi:hypothetical protein
MAIKLKTSPLDRRYRVSHNVIYDIESVKSGTGVFLNNTDNALQTADANAILPKLTIYSYPKNFDLNTKKDKDGNIKWSEIRDKTVEVFYLDQFMEDGDKWVFHLKNGNNDTSKITEYDKVGGADSVQESVYPYNIAKYFFDKCAEEIKVYINQQTKRGQTVDANDVNLMNDSIIPRWFFVGSGWTEGEYEFAYFVDSNDIDCLRKSLSDIINSSYINLLKDETSSALNAAKTKYNTPTIQNITVKYFIEGEEI